MVVVVMPSMVKETSLTTVLAEDEPPLPPEALLLDDSDELPEVASVEEVDEVDEVDWVAAVDDVDAAVVTELRGLIVIGGLA
jgi:hypothetical protein